MKRFLRVPVLAAVAVLVAASAASAVTATSAAAPSNASAPSISGQAAAGGTVTANPGTWRGSAPITFQYQWRICGANGGACHDIAGGTGRSTRSGTAIREHAGVHVIASNADGSSSARSGPSARIAAPSDAPKIVSPPTISRRPVTRQHAHRVARRLEWGAADDFQYQWLICGANGDACQTSGLDFVHLP